MEETWKIDRESADQAKTDVTDPHALKKWEKYETTVTTNPFYHPKHKRIAKLTGTTYPEGTYRFRDDPLRVVYYPDKPSCTILTLAAGSPSNISYKKRSQK